MTPEIVRAGLSAVVGSANTLPVDDALVVRGFERFRDLTRDREGLIKRDWTFPHAIRKSRPLHQFQHECCQVFRLFETVDRPDVLVIQ